MSAVPPPRETLGQSIDAYRPQWISALKVWNSELSKKPLSDLTGIPESLSTNVAPQEAEFAEEAANSVRSHAVAGFHADLESKFQEVITSIGLHRRQEIKPGSVNFKIDFKGRTQVSNTPTEHPGMRSLLLEISARSKGENLPSCRSYRFAISTELPTTRLQDGIALAKEKLSSELADTKGREDIMSGFDEFVSGDQWAWPALQQSLGASAFVTRVTFGVQATGDTGYEIIMAPYGWIWGHPGPEKIRFHSCYTGNSSELLESLDVFDSSPLLEPQAQLPSQSEDEQGRQEDRIAFPEAGEEDLISF